MKRVLLVFARYPEVGKCKTRLIGELGPEGAAELHTQMTHYTINWARELRDLHDVHVQVRFAGGSEASMSALFGADLEYVAQCEGDLGSRLTEAFLTCSTDAEQIIVVGTDCPQLNATSAFEAFESLNEHNVCLAPAFDGGYALLGCQVDAGESSKELCETLFNDKSWGSEHVLAETISSLNQTLRSSLNKTPRSVCLLKTLADVDHPADIPVWRSVQTGELPKRPEISVIIPVLNEETGLEAALDAALSDDRIEILLVAAGDTRTTLTTAANRKVRFVSTSPPRASQMNLGARYAKADVLLFLHADSCLPAGYVDLVLDTLANKSISAGAFCLRIDSNRWLARLVEWGVSLRTRLRQLPYGDQSLFLRRETFEKCNGFPNQEIMEDYCIARELKRVGKIQQVAAQVVTSSRRWHNLGFLRTTAINQLVILGFHFRIGPQRLASFYRKKR